MDPVDHSPEAIRAAFQKHNLTLEELVGRLDEISRTAIRATKDGVVDDSATRLRATEDLIDILQTKLEMKLDLARRSKQAPKKSLTDAMKGAIEAEVVKPELPAPEGQ